MKSQRRYLLHDWTVQVEAGSSEWLDAVTEILGAYLNGEDSVPPPSDRVLHARLQLGSGFPVPETLEQKAHFQSLVFYREKTGGDLWIDVHGHGWVQVNTDEGELQAHLDLDPLRDGWMVAHHALYPGLLELLKARGLFSAHAGLVASEGRGILICGASGSGKTTLALGLAGRGYGFLADDTCFLREQEGQVEGLAFWEDLHVTEETIQRFPSLDFLKKQAPRRENWKRHFSVGQLDGLKPEERCLPEVLLFPRIDHADRSTLSDLSGVEAAVRLIPQSVVPVRRETTERHMEMIGALCNQVHAFEISMSDDLEEVCDQVEQSVEKVLA